MIERHCKRDRRRSSVQLKIRNEAYLIRKPFMKRMLVVDTAKSKVKSGRFFVTVQDLPYYANETYLYGIGGVTNQKNMCTLHTLEHTKVIPHIKDAKKNKERNKRRRRMRRSQVAAEKTKMQWLQLE